MCDVCIKSYLKAKTASIVFVVTFQGFCFDIIRERFLNCLFSFDI